jgi:hypothetical protein
VETETNPVAFPAKVDPIPASIVKAVCAVKSTLEAVKKSQRNNHGNYNFASTDDIYAAITKKMGGIGLMCLALEDSYALVRQENSKGEKVMWLKVSYAFVLATEDATWSDPRSRRSLCVQILGAQSFQAAQSYAEKSYFRSLFSIPTGDMDLDSLPEGFSYSPAGIGDENATLNADQRAELVKIAEDVGADIEKFCKVMGVIEIASIHQKDFQHAKGLLETKRKS